MKPQRRLEDKKRYGLPEFKKVFLRCYVMAYDLFIYLEFESESDSKMMEAFFSRKGRPDFEEDVDEQYQPLFTSIEELEFANECKFLSSTTLALRWFEYDRVGFQDFIPSFEASSATKAIGREVVDDPMSMDSEDEETIYWLWQPNAVQAFSSIAQLEAVDSSAGSVLPK